jgi:transcriptional regulator with XRE-family HTH domain
MILLKLEREQRGWSQAELARRANLNANTISLIESGRFVPYPRQLSRIAGALNWPEAQAHRLLEREPQGARSHE